jgi:hypothetical protein
MRRKYTPKISTVLMKPQGGAIPKQGALDETILAKFGLAFWESPLEIWSLPIVKHEVEVFMNLKHM